MTIKYAYHNPTTGESAYADSPEELRDALARMAADVYINHYCLGNPYSVVELLENGAEKWYAPTGEPIMTQEELAQLVKHVQSFVQAESIPVSTMG